MFYVKRFRQGGKAWIRKVFYAKRPTNALTKRFGEKNWFGSGFGTYQRKRDYNEP